MFLVCWTGSGGTQTPHQYRAVPPNPHRGAAGPTDPSLRDSGQRSAAPVLAHAPLPVSGVDPAGALVDVVDVVNFAVKVSGLLPTVR